jgi:hypothetical protein
MQAQRSRDAAVWPTEPDDVARTVYAIVSQRYPALVAVDELVLALCEPSLEQAVDQVYVYDALTELAASGLIHRLDRFVFSTHTAVRAAAITAPE